MVCKGEDGSVERVAHEVPGPAAEAVCQFRAIARRDDGLLGFRPKNHTGKRQLAGSDFPCLGGMNTMHHSPLYYHPCFAGHAWKKHSHHLKGSFLQEATMQ